MTSGSDDVMRAHRHIAAISGALLVSALTAHVSAAADAAPAADPAVTAKATELFRAGRAAAAAGDNKTACDRFTESEQLQPAPGTQLNLGACEEKQGHLLAAREHFRKAASSFGPEDRRRAVAVNSASTLTDRLGTLTVHIPPAAPSGTSVTINDAPVDSASLAHGIEVDPGKIKLVVSAAGRQPHTIELVVAEAEKHEVTAEPGEPVVAEPPTPAPVPPDDGKADARSLQRTLGFVGVGVGGAGLIVGGVFGGLALHEASVVKANCNTTTWACKAPGVSAASSGQTDGVVSTIGFVAGAAFAAAGIYLVIRTWGPSHDGRPVQPLGLVLAPVVSPQEQGLTGIWSF